MPTFSDSSNLQGFFFILSFFFWHVAFLMSIWTFTDIQTLWASYINARVHFLGHLVIEILFRQKYQHCIRFFLDFFFLGKLSILTGDGLVFLIGCITHALVFCRSVSGGVDGRPFILLIVISIFYHFIFHWQHQTTMTISPVFNRRVSLQSIIIITFCFFKYVSSHSAARKILYVDWLFRLEQIFVSRHSLSGLQTILKLELLRRDKVPLLKEAGSIFQVVSFYVLVTLILDSFVMIPYDKL